MTEVFLALFLLLNAADIYTTDKALNMKGRREANPLLNFLFKKFPRIPTMIVIKAPGCIGLWYVDNAILTGLCCIIYVAVVGNNLSNLRRG